MKKLFVSIFFVFLLNSVSYADCFVFTYFLDNGQDGLHLAWSEDGLNWTPVKGGKSLLKPTLSKDQLMRDPSICRGPDGTFHMVWTVSWKDRGIGYASSRDLIHWSEQKLIPVMDHEPSTRNAWAPEVFYDESGKEFYIIWASTIPGRFSPESEGTSEDRYDHRQYYTTTKDFQSFAPTKLYHDFGHNIIDAFLTKDGEKYLLFYKDETLKPERKTINLATAKSPEGPFEVLGEVAHTNWVEGPTAIKIGDFWYLYYDCYRMNRYGLVRSKDLKNWENLTDSLHFIKNARHGTILRVSSEELEKLKALD